MTMSMVSLHFQRRHLRRTAVLTLIAWVLALVGGIVNACQLQTHAPGSYASPGPSHREAAEQAMHAGHVLPGEEDAQGVDGGPGRHDADSAKAACLKFCNDESSTVAKHEAAQSDLPGMLAVASIDWQPETSAAAVTAWRSVERPGSRGPPLFIRFLRLTI